MRIERSLTIVLLLLAIAGCGGGGSSGSSAPSSSSSRSSSSSSSSSSSGASTANVLTVVVDSGPAALNGQGAFNVPFVSVTLCETGTTTCATIDHLLVDTGSSGVRIFASVLAAAGLNPAITTDPNNPQNSVAECLPFVDGYVWGPLSSVTLQAGGETASNLPIQIISDTTSFTPSVPTACTNLTSSTSLNSVQSFGANGVIGVGNFAQDCGTSCADCSVSGIDPCSPSNQNNNDIYYSCNATTNTCTSIPVALAQQVQNPVVLFATDNNGVILTLPAIPAAGQATAQGTLTFGIGTQTDNSLGSAFVLTLDGGGYFTSTFNGTTLDSSFIDSGSNAYFFNDSSLTACPGSGNPPTAPYFYCPSSTQNFSVSNQGHDASGNPTGASKSVPFQIADLNAISDSDFAIDDAGGTAATSSGTVALNDDFDFGLSFFYGRSVFTGIEGKTAGGASGVTGPYFAY